MMWKSIQEIRLIADSVPALVAYIDAEGYYQFVNGQYEKWFGLSRKEILGKHYTAILGDNACQRIAEHVEKVLSGERVLFEASLPYARGGRRWVSAEYIPDADDRGMVKGFFGLITDITDRRRVEKELRQSEEMFRSIFENSMDAIFLTAPDGRVFSANRAACEMTGFSENEIIELGRESVVDPTDPRLPGALEERRQRGCFRGELNWRRKDGSRIPVEITSSIFRDTKGQERTIIVGRDIADRKRMEEELRQSEEKYRLLFELESDALLLIDDESLQILDANSAAIALYKYSREELLTKKVLDLSAEPEKSLQAIKQRVARIPLRYHLKKDGSLFPAEITRTDFQWQGTAVHIAAVRDISSRVEAEKDLHETRELLMSILDNSPALIYVNTLDNRYRMVNKAWERFTGRNMQEAVGRAFEELFSFRTASEFQMTHRKVLDTKVPVVFEESVLHGGRKYFLHTAKFPLIGQNGEMKFIGGISVDISDLRRAEEELREAREQLYQSQKMEILNTLAAGVAHEISNPISVILFNAPLLRKIWCDFQPVLEEQTVADPGRKYGGLPFDFLKRDLNRLLNDMEMAGNRVAAIVNGLKDFARKSAMTEKKPMVLNEAVENALRLASTAVRESGVALQIELGAALPPMIGNLQNIEQVVLNILINGVQAIKHGKGVIEVRTGYDERREGLTLFIRDNGEGIDPSVSRRIFDPFFTTRKDAGGSGLGLSISYNMVKEHDGEITFESEKGKGTTFRVFFPVKRGERRYKILVADDEELILQIMSEAFRKLCCFDVETSRNGTEALLKVGTCRPDILILDLMMSGMDGLEVCRSIRELPELSHMVVIIYTGYPEDPRLNRIRELGYTHIFAKQMKIMEFVKEVEKIAGSR